MNINLGLGVMLKMLGGNNEETVRTFSNAVGKSIKTLELVDNKLRFTFIDESGIALFDDGQSCCERRYMHTDDKLEDFVGTRLLGAEVRDGGVEDDEWGDVKESQFLIISTSIGEFTVVNYNEHNGYYGGFWIVCKAIN